MLNYSYMCKKYHRKCSIIPTHEGNIANPQLFRPAYMCRKYYCNFLHFPAKSPCNTEIFPAQLQK